MPDAFFANSKKRKRPQGNIRNSGKTFANGKTKSKNQPKDSRRKKDEELSEGGESDIDDLDLRASDIDPNESDGGEYATETPAEKRLRLAKVYLDSVREDLATAEGEYDAAEVDKEIISSRLKEDVLEHAGKLHIRIADTLNLTRGSSSYLRVKPHRLAVTAAVLSDDSNFLYTSGKDGGISCYDLSSVKRISCISKLRHELKGKGKAKAFDNDIKGHTDEVLALAISGDGKYLASGGKDRRIGVWNIESGEYEGQRLTWLRGFTGHKDTISGLSFRKSTNTLYSSSFDRTVKLFDLSPGVMGYVETLFGHQDAITDVDSLKGDTAITAAGRDRTVRFWKITEETQLVFRGGGSGKSKMRDLLETGLEVPDGEESNRKQNDNEMWIEGSVDCVAMIDENTFLSGGDSGTISLWITTKKKPIFSYPVAHGLEEMESSTEGKLRRPRWITSLGCLRYGDLFASGSWDGHIRLWKVHSSSRSFTPLGTLEIRGIVNSLQVSLISKDWSLDKTWSKPPKQTWLNGGEPNRDEPPESEKQHKMATPAARKDEGVLITAAIGQEPRFGRWVKLKSDGAVNCAVIFAIRTDTH